MAPSAPTMCAVPTFPRTVPRTVSLPRGDPLNRISMTENSFNTAAPLPARQTTVPTYVADPVGRGTSGTVMMQGLSSRTPGEVPERYAFASHHICFR